MSRIRVAGVLGAATAALVTAVLAPIGTASAQTATIVDGSGDAWRVFYDPSTDVRDQSVVEAAPNADVTAMTVDHRRKQITVTATYADLVQDDARMPGIREWFRLDDGGGAMLNLYVVDSWSDPEVFFWHKPLDIPWAQRQRARCAGVRSTFDFGADTWTTKLPTSCLDDPRWVQFHGATDAGSGEAATGVQQIYFQDNAGSTIYQEPAISVSQYCFSQCEGWTKKLRPRR